MMIAEKISLPYTTRLRQTSSTRATSTPRTPCPTRTMTTACASNMDTLYNRTQSTSAKWRELSQVDPVADQTPGHQQPELPRAQAADTLEPKTTGSTPEKSDNASIHMMNLGSQSALRAKTESSDIIMSTPTSSTSASGQPHRPAPQRQEPNAAAHALTNQSRSQSRSPRRAFLPT